MQAIIVTGGKQYNVKEGDVIYIEKLAAEAAKVEAKVLKNGKGKKIRVFKYRSKKDSKSLQGHRQPYTKVQIEKIAL